MRVKNYRKFRFEESAASTVGNVTITSEGSTIVFKVENTPGAELPSTGGSGFGLIYLSGIMLMGLACAGLLMRRRWRSS